MHLFSNAYYFAPIYSKVKWTSWKVPDIYTEDKTLEKQVPRSPDLCADFQCNYPYIIRNISRRTQIEKSSTESG